VCSRLLPSTAASTTWTSSTVQETAAAATGSQASAFDDANRLVAAINPSEVGDDELNRTRFQSEWVPLQAGKKVSLHVEFTNSGPGDLHLCWESQSQEIEHIPQAALYPGSNSPADQMRNRPDERCLTVLSHRCVFSPCFCSWFGPELLL